MSTNLAATQGGAIRTLQRGVIRLNSGSLTNTATLSPALADTTKTELRFLGCSMNTNDSSFLAYPTLTNTTTVTATRQNSSGFITDVAWEITERY